MTSSNSSAARAIISPNSMTPRLLPDLDGGDRKAYQGFQDAHCVPLEGVYANLQGVCHSAALHVASDSSSNVNNSAMVTHGHALHMFHTSNGMYRDTACCRLSAAGGVTGYSCSYRRPMQKSSATKRYQTYRRPKDRWHLLDSGSPASSAQHVDSRHHTHRSAQTDSANALVTALIVDLSRPFDEATRSRLASLYGPREEWVVP